MSKYIPKGRPKAGGPTPATRVCTKCNVEQPSSEYRKNKNYVGGIVWQCKSCIRAMARAHWARTREHSNQVKREWREKNRAHVVARHRRYVEKNRRRLCENSLRWSKANPEKQRARVQARNARIRNAIPVWADQTATQQFYLDCPKGMDVDHIVPITSRYVCGLHWVGNLQYLDPLQNRIKNNRFWPDMPDEIRERHEQRWR